MKVRKKPVIVDAVPFYKDLWEMKPDKYPMVSYWALTELVTPYPYIGTIEGPMKVSDGDYIIKGVNGEFYPCKPDIFEKTYEAIVSPSLTDDQQVVLDYLKKMCPPELGVSAMVTTYCLVDDNINDNWQEYSEEIPEHIEALQKLSVAEENQVLAAFAEWGLSNL
ncbi:hypothetical protein [Enterococcus diestrammenae]|uniref:DUF1642 domain-containing protein n=1 Tax=Enterococcus diestrammenae TaxID=1155073 RepID=A0ABV0F2I6_9ENTE|nr:hypothetical protein [Enterococcus diestrammenae]KAF1299695.1 hypothetical protein BAU18_07140 [Enterococcus diestrammenae]